MLLIVIDTQKEVVQVYCLFLVQVVCDSQKYIAIG